MNPKIVLILLAMVLSCFIGWLSWGFFVNVWQVLDRLDSTWWALVGLAIIVHLVGHYLRMLRTKTVLDQIKVGSESSQFGALATGYLFSALLPFRGGELIRAFLIAVKLRISFLYTFTVIVLERSIDLLLVGLLVVAFSTLLDPEAAFVLVLLALGAIVFAVVVLGGLVLLVRENRTFLTVIWRVTNWFRPSIRNHIQFKVWSLIFGLQKFMAQKSALRRYIMLTLASWSLYVVSTAVIVVPLLHTGLLRSLVAASAPYVAVGASYGPSYTVSYQQAIGPMAQTVGSDAVAQYATLAWVVLTLPMAAVGLVNLLAFNEKWVRRSKFASNEAYANKLLRNEDISQEFPAFLDSYFRGHSLAKVLHKLEIAGELSLVKFFKGGSDAITILVLSRKKLFVKKIIPIEYEDRLKAQYDWLVAHKHIPHIVKTLGEQRTDEYYAIDLEYDPKNIDFFEYAHHFSFAQATEVLDGVLRTVYEELHKDAKPLAQHAAQRKQYIEKHIVGCFEKAAAKWTELAEAAKPEKIVINGIEYDNLFQILEKIKKHPRAWQDLATYRESRAVFGDLAIDNILVSPAAHRALLIDPAPDGNVINGLVFDMGKWAQSLYCGYEFSFRDDDPVRLNPGGSINYRDHRSSTYSRLWRYVSKELAPEYLSESEQRSLIFHGGALHIRRLKHQVVSSPETSLKLYAVGVKTLNAFLDQYK
jgi:hypothetical protein